MKRWFIFSNLFHHLSEVGMKVLPTATKGFNFCGLVSAMVLSHWVQHFTYTIWFHAEHGPPGGLCSSLLHRWGKCSSKWIRKSPAQKTPLLEPGTRIQDRCEQIPQGEPFRSSPPGWSQLPHCLADMNWANVGITMVRVSAPDLLPLHSLISP